MFINFVLDQKEINQLQELRKSQDEPLVPAEPINPFVSLQAGYSWAGVFWYISKPRLDLHPHFGSGPKRGGTARADWSEPGAATSAECSRGFHLHLRGSAELTAPSFPKCLPEQPSSHNGRCRIKPLCHWVSKRYLSGHEVIWSHSSLFKNGALPHQLVLGGLVISEGAAEGWWKFECGGR